MGWQSKVHCARPASVVVVFPGDRLSISNGGRPPSWILKSSKFLAAVPVRRANIKYVSPSQISCRSLEPLHRYDLFSIFKMAAVRNFVLSKVRNFTYRSATKGQYAFHPKFRADRSNLCGWPIFLIF